MAIARADLLEWFNYNHQTGVFTWKKRPSRGGNFRKVGDVAGSFQKGINRRVLWLKGKRMYAGRAAYVYVHGEIPDDVLVDHSDGNTLNDRVSNMRLASEAQNNWNRIQRAGSTLRLGVTKTVHGRFRSRIQLPTGEKLYLGTWDTEEEAHAAYMGAAAVLHGDFWIANRAHSAHSYTVNRTASSQPNMNESAQVEREMADLIDRVGSSPSSGAGGRRFESSRSDQLHQYLSGIRPNLFLVCAQLPLSFEVK